MSFRKTITFGIPFALVTIISANSANALFYDNVYKLLDRTVTGDTFNANLAREYQKLALFESEKMFDWTDAENHAVKGNLAAEGKLVMPYNPAEWKIEGKSNLIELQDARGKLVASLDSGARTAVPSLAAEAQAKYDCWVEQQEEGHQPTHIEACKDQFWQAMASMDAAMAPKITAAPPVTKTLVTVSQEIAREVVFFDFDKAEIKPQEQQKIDNFISRMRTLDGVELSIVGHTDKSGPADYNQILSAKRAKSVTDKLVSEGMQIRELDDLVVTAEGETAPAVSTADGVAEPRNRRVEIVAIGDVEVEQTVATAQTRKN